MTPTLMPTGFDATYVAMSFILSAVGAFVAASVLLGIYVNTNFLWFTLFVGLNLFQSAFTQWCPMMTILRKAGVRG